MFSIKWSISLTLILFSVLLFSETTKCQEDPYLPFVEVMPAPVGGMKAIYQNTVYPEIAKNNGIKGKVYLLLYINENGGLDDIKVIKGIGGGCNEAAVAGVKAVKFTPGKNNGKQAKTKLSLAVNF
jgi:periplasmic protein TonB